MHATISISVGDQTTIGAQRDTASLTRIVSLVYQRHTPVDVPNGYCSICTAGRQNVTVAAERNPAHPTMIALERAD
jgi:hypothetical protein